MSRPLPFLAACLLAACLGAHAQAPQPRAESGTTEEMDLKPAMSAAAAWLSIVDLGLYGQSWETAAVLFKDAVPRIQWEKSLQELRGALGPLASRKLASATYTRTMPGGPPGEYVVIQYHSRFENRPLATEIVTPMRDKDGVWRVSGYFIR